LTSIAWVTFPISAGDAKEFASRDARQTRLHAVGSGGVIQAAKALLRSLPAGMTIASTREAALARCMFNQADYPWTLQAQAVLLSAAPIDSTTFTRAMWIAILDGEWEEQIEALRSAGVTGLIRPGVDGDVAGVFALTQECFDALHAALERAALSAGLTWSVLSEADFASALAGH
jgi:hypothetical protein